MYTIQLQRVSTGYSVIMEDNSLASQTLYLPVGGRKGSGNRAYVSFPSPRTIGDNTSACIAYGVWFCLHPVELLFHIHVVLI